MPSSHMRVIGSRHIIKHMLLKRHVETDEVFVLLDGQAVLFLVEGEQKIEKLHFQVMQPGKLFNVRKNAWHACVLSRDAIV